MEDVDNTAESAAPAPDFRVQVAERRRERMRARLLDAVLNLYQPDRGAEHLVIDDVIRAADVSRGTFYKYFDSIDQAVIELGETLTSGMMTDYQALFGSETELAVELFGGPAMTIARAWHDPRWGGFTCRVDYVDYLGRRNAYDILVRSRLEQARTQGLIQFRSLDVALDMLVGATVQGRRRLMNRGPNPRAYIDEILQWTFAGLGMAPKLIESAGLSAWQRILDGVPALGWWPPESDWDY